MKKTTRKRIVLKPWARVTLIAVCLVVLGLFAFIITNSIVGGDDGIPERNPSPTEQPQPPSEDQQAATEPSPSVPIDSWGREIPYTVKVCDIVNGAYVNSVAEAQALDSRLYGYYQGVKDESPVLASFIDYLHDDPSDLKWINEQLTEDVTEECADQ